MMCRAGFDLCKAQGCVNNAYYHRAMTYFQGLDWNSTKNMLQMFAINFSCSSDNIELHVLQKIRK